MSQEPIRPCKNCGEELSLHDTYRRQLCQNQYLIKIAKKWGLASIAITAILCFGVGHCWAQEWGDASVTVNGRSVLLSMQNPTFVQAEPDSVITGQIHTTYPETPICTLQSCTSNTKSDVTLGGYDEDFTAIMGNDTNGEKFQVLNEQNIPTYTIIFVNPPNQHMFDHPDNTPDWERWLGGILVALGILPIAIVVGGTIFGIVVTIRHLRNVGRRNRRWRLN